jgi:uncharacterized protein
MKRYFAISLLVLGGLLLAACGTTTPVTVTSQPVQRTISVNGEGIVKVVPDIALASVGVETRNANVGAAVNDNNTKTTAVIAAIKAQGVQDADIQTSNFSVYFQDMSGGVNNLPVGTGQYVVDNTVTVTIHDISKLGAILGDALGAGANSVSSVSFTLSDPSTATSQARALALKDAQTRAGELAGGLGIKVGNVLSVSESTSTSPSPFLAKAAAGYGGGGAVPVSAGLYEVDVTVSVVFEIQ